jgi:hypothetical protein
MSRGSRPNQNCKILNLKKTSDRFSNPSSCVQGRPAINTQPSTRKQETRLVIGVKLPIVFPRRHSQTVRRAMIESIGCRPHTL